MKTLSLISLALVTVMAVAKPPPPSAHLPGQAASDDSADKATFSANSTSPVRGLKRPPSSNEGHASASDSVPSVDGSGNNLSQPDMGKAHTPLQRIAAANYLDGIEEIDDTRPSARLISNLVFAQADSEPNPYGATDYLWQWGQFLDHDLDLTDGVEPQEPLEISVPAGDAFFDPSFTGTQVLQINRSLYDPLSGTSPQNPRQQVNEITAWIDASNVYGSDVNRADALRLLDGSGKLRTSEGGLLPFNTMGLANAGGDSPQLFVAGDVRANEQIGLTTMHTLFVREHNRLVDRFAADNPSLSGEELYQKARLHVIAQMQVITYREFLPLILGHNALPVYQGYQDRVNAGITNEFSTAAYRFGHTMLSGQILRLDSALREIPAGHLPLRDAFFRPDRLLSDGGIEPILRGLANQQSQTIDSHIVDDVRNFLFGAPGNGGFDLAAINIQRGRDHGLPTLNAMRRSLGLRAYQHFSDISDKATVQHALQEAYQSVEDIDLWVGGLAEGPHQQAMVGETFYHILKRQFVALRDGDRFWYQNVFSGKALERLEKTRLSDIIRRNTLIGDELQHNVFLMPTVSS